LYTIDDQTEVRNPLGLYGSRLAVEIYVVLASINHLQNLHKAVNNCGYEIKELVFSGLADSYSLFDEGDMRQNVALIDIGSSLTEVSLFQAHALQDIEVLSLGVSDLRALPETDENFKSIVTRIKGKVDEYRSKGIVVNYALVAGGGLLVDGIIESLESNLGIPVRAGVVRHLSGNIGSLDSMIATTAIGLVRYARQKYQPVAAVQPKNLVKLFATKVVDVFNNYF
jgi:cell division ATPase FtsA